MPGILTVKPQGSYSLFADTSRFGKSLDVCTYIAKEAHVLTSPGFWFGPVVGDKGLRIVFVCAEHKKITEGLNRMKSAMMEHPANNS